MRNNRYQKQVTSNRLTLPVVVFFCTLCWILNYILFPSLSSNTEVQTLLEVQLTEATSTYWLNQIISYLLYGLTGYFLIEINNRFGIIRMRASVQTAIYFLLVTACPEMHMLNTGNIASLTTLISIYFLFRSYQHNESSSDLFYSFLCLGIGSILFPQITFLAIPWLMTAYRFQSLNFRSFCGAFVGWIFPYWLLFGHAFFYQDMELFYQPFQALTNFGKVFDFSMINTWKWATLGYLLILFTISAFHCIIAGFEDKIRTRAYLQFFIELSLLLFISIILQPIHCSRILPLLMICCSILIGHYFALTGSKGSNRLFIAANIALIYLFCYNLWTHL